MFTNLLRALPLIFLLGTPTWAFAQVTDTFPSDPMAFVAELGTFLAETKNTELDQVLREIGPQIGSGGYTAEEFSLIRRTCNLMRKRKLSAIPYYKRYLELLPLFKSQSAQAESFQAWHRIQIFLLEPSNGKSVQDFSAFLGFTKGLLLTQSLQGSEGMSIGWKINTPNWSFDLVDQEPVVLAKNTTLTAFYLKDSIQIFQTNGTFYPLRHTWEGQGGKATWERRALPAEVTLEKYTIDTRKGIYSSENALLSYPKFFGTAQIRGIFSDKISLETTENKGRYPQFESVQERVEIKELGEGMRYVGGFKLEGTTVYGVGTSDNKSLLQIYNQRGALVFKGLSKQFTVQESTLLTGNRVEATFYYQGDSIFHPSVDLQFKIASKELRLSRGETGSDRNPFFSSSHQMRIDVEEIIAFLERDSVIIGKPSIQIARKGPVAFESLQYFSPNEYEALQGLSSVNPVALLYAISKREGSRFLSADRFASGLNSKFTATNIERLLFDLEAQGFITYYMEKRQIELKEKVSHFADAAASRIDYDQIKLVSNTDRTNAILHVHSKQIDIQGIEWVPFSLKQRVVLLPDSGRVSLGQDRNMKFSGLVQAGFSELRSSHFQFNYQKFQIQADSIERFRLFAPEKRPSENPEQIPFALTSDIQEFNATLLIDAENNKSGKSDIPIFPSLNSTSKSYVFYDGAFAKDTVYKRDSFYFELDPFHLNNLDNYVKEELKFKGWLISARIFPAFRETLKVQPDYALGFQHQTPADGYGVYQDRGKFTGLISLSNQGLSGKGTLAYLGARINADDYLFKPNLMQGSALAFDVPEVRGKNETPKVHGTEVQINWPPYSDSMYVTSASEAFQLFQEGIHTLSGRLILTPNAINGSGTLDWPRAKINASLLSFGAYSVKADTMSLGIKALETDQYAIQTQEINGSVDFDTLRGVFKANQGFLTTALPFNQYETSMNEFDWDMSRETVTFKSDTAQLGTFTSRHPDQDTLVFQGKTAFYDLNTNLLKIGGSPYIVSADAFIYPDSGKVDIQAGGTMNTLENAVIVCDTLTKNHKISRATVQVLGRKEYRASGFYEYPIGNKMQEIAFSNIQGTRVGKGARSQKATATLAQGEITEADSFLIDNKTSFFGQISLGSESANLKFDGFARLESEKLPERNWFSISMEADKKSLNIPFRNPKNEEAVPLDNGLFLSKESAIIYPRIMMPLYFRKDRAIFPARGVLRYDGVKEQFILGDSTKILEDELLGNKLTFFSKTGRLEAEGKFNLGSGLKYYRIVAAGSANTQFSAVKDSGDLNAAPVPVEFNLIAGLDFLVPDRLLRVVQNELASSSFAASPIPYLSDIQYYRKGFSEIFPAGSGLNDALSSLSNGILGIPEKDNPYTLLLSGLKMRWDMDYQSLVTKTPEVGLISIKGKPVNQMLTCYAEFKMPSNEDDRAYIYLQLPNQLYYYFGYRNGILELNSNDNRFMDEASKMKGSELNLKMPDGQPYEIQIVEASRAQMFLRRAQAAGK